MARRIDVIPTAIKMKATVYDLEEFELCYAPQFGAAKDPVNVAGMIAGNVLLGNIGVPATPQAICDSPNTLCFFCYTDPVSPGQNLSVPPTPL